VTADALSWCAREHVAVFVVAEGEFLTVTDAAGGRLATQELAVRKRQWECVLNPARRLDAAKAIVTAKIKTLKLEPTERDALVKKAAGARSVQDAVIVEWEAGSTYWRAWHGREMRFKDGSKVEFDTRARSWRTGRLGEGGAQTGNRFALHPINAMVNYAGAIMVSQLARALTGLGADVAFGVLHSTRPGMVALAWDAYELLRVRTEEAVFEFVGARRFGHEEFKVEHEPKPHVEFSGSLVRELAVHVMQTVPFRVVVKTCRGVIELF
jgi:CRISP-associated protein Cas1